MDKTRIEYNEYDISHEVLGLKKFLENQKMNLDPQFLNCMSKGDIVEVYSFPEHRQIFANKEFEKLSSYSEEQMRTIPFQKLFWRETEIQQSLIQRAISVVQTGKCEKWNLPPHDLVEALHPKRRTFEVHMGWVAPIYDNSGRVVAWASTVKVEYVFEWPSNSDLD